MNITKIYIEWEKARELAYLNTSKDDLNRVLQEIDNIFNDIIDYNSNQIKLCA
jgi:hypothetical protein